jgi:hypothetical protein
VARRRWSSRTSCRRAPHRPCRWRLRLSGCARGRVTAGPGSGCQRRSAVRPAGTAPGSGRQTHRLRQWQHSRCTSQASLARGRRHPHPEF